MWYSSCGFGRSPSGPPELINRVLLSPSSFTTIVVISALFEHLTTTLPLISSRFVNETFPGWSRTMEACIDMLADQGGAMGTFVLYCGMDLSPLKVVHFLISICNTCQIFQASHGWSDAFGDAWRIFLVEGRPPCVRLRREVGFGARMARRRRWAAWRENLTPLNSYKSSFFRATTTSIRSANCEQTDLMVRVCT